MSGFIRAHSHSEAQHEQAGDHEAAAFPLRISHLQVELGVALRATASGNVRHFFHPKAGHLLL